MFHIINYIIITLVVFGVYNFFLSRSMKSLILGNSTLDATVLFVVFGLIRKYLKNGIIKEVNVAKFIDSVNNYFNSKYG